MGRLFGNGINQGDLVDLIVAIRASITGIQTKLDSDTGVNDTDYHTNAATALAALPSGIQTSGVKAIHNEGVLTSILSDLITKWNATLTKLDADSQVTDANFNSLHAITNVVGNTKLDGIIDTGQYQSCVINVLNSLLTKINSVATKLDADAGVTDTNYNALWAVTDNVDEVGTVNRVKIGITSWIIGFLVFGTLLCGPRPAYAGAGVEGDVVTSTVTLNTSPALDMSNVDRFSMQASYSNGTPALGFTATDGRKSTDTLTVVSTLTLTGQQGTNSITVASNTLSGQSFTLNGYVFAAGSAWPLADKSSATATNIAAAISAYGPFSGLLTAVASSSVTTITCVSSGTACNSFTLASSTPAALVVGSATFTGGVEHAVIMINGNTLTEGVNWTNGPSTVTTAVSISSAIVNLAALSGVVVSSNASNVVFSTSSLPGLNAYATFSSSPTALKWSAPVFGNGLASSFNGTTDAITQTTTPFVNGLAVLFATSSATNPISPLLAGTTYFVVRVDDNSFKLATSTTNAAAGTIVDISTNQTGADSWTITPLALSAAPAGMKWQASNDSSNWTDLPTATVSSVTYSSAGSSIWDFQFFNYRYIRPLIVAPTSGGILWKIRIRGKATDQ